MWVQTLLQVAVSAGHDGGAATVVVAGTVGVVGDDATGVLRTEVLDRYWEGKYEKRNITIM